MSAAKRDVLYGTLGLMILNTLEALGPLHGYRIARRLEQISGNALLEQLGWVSTKWGDSDTGRRVKVYALTRAGRKQLQAEEDEWRRAVGIVDRFFRISEELS